MTPGEVAHIVEHRSDGMFIGLLRKADSAFEDQSFEPSLADVLRAEPRLTHQWATWSADQRWTPSAYVEGTETGWYDAGYQHVRVHSNEAEAVANFIHRISAWLSRREVLAFGE